MDPAELAIGDVIGTHAFGPVKCVRDARANILKSEMAVKPRLSNPPGWLFRGSAKDELAAGLVYLGGEFFQRLKAGGIDGRHITEPQDDDGWNLIQTGNDGIEFVGGAEEEGAVDSEDADIGGNFFVLQNMDVTMLRLTLNNS